VLEKRQSVKCQAKVKHYSLLTLVGLRENGHGWLHEPHSHMMSRVAVSDMEGYPRVCKDAAKASQAVWGQYYLGTIGLLTMESRVAHDPIESIMSSILCHRGRCQAFICLFTHTDNSS
jgi:hypothetical protein